MKDLTRAQRRILEFIEGEMRLAGMMGLRIRPRLVGSPNKLGLPMTKRILTLDFVRVGSYLALSAVLK